MGSVVLSLDAELGWGFHDLSSPPVDRVEAGRRGWNRMLELLETFEIPATWAIVGHLMLETCDGVHATHPAPADWFERERTSWRNRPDLRFGSELVDAVIDSPVEHEVGSHSFSHVLFGEPETTSELADAEVKRCVDIADDWGLTLDSFVFPRNDIGHLDRLAAHGFGCYRGSTPTPEGIRSILDVELRDRSLLVRPRIDEHGLVNVPASSFLFGFQWPGRSLIESVWADPMVRLACRGIDQAARSSDGVFHAWLHPNNLIDERDDARMRAILEHIDRRRRESDLTVETMGAVARRISDRSEPNSWEIDTGSVADESIASDGGSGGGSCGRKGKARSRTPEKG